jgi:Icc-related predicted phosphoesterase
MRCVFTSDLHGDTDRYQKLGQIVAVERPDVLFLGGDLFPSTWPPGGTAARAFLADFLAPQLRALRANMRGAFPRLLLIMGNDDERAAEPDLLEMEREGLLEYIHQKRVPMGAFDVYGYACVPPSPFRLKDWERYDVSRYVDPGCVSPEEGICTYPISQEARRYSTIKTDLEQLVGSCPLDRALFLFHAPAYDTRLDRAALDGLRVDGVPVDVHVGSIAVRRFIEARQPLLTLHGHVHESPALSCSWQDRIGRTRLFSAAHAGPELAIVRFEPEQLDQATRELL